MRQGGKDAKIVALSGWQPIFDWRPAPSGWPKIILGMLVAIGISVASAYVLRVAQTTQTRSIQGNYQITLQPRNGDVEALQDEVVFPSSALKLPATDWPDEYRPSYRSYEPKLENWPRPHAPSFEAKVTDYYDVVLPPVKNPTETRK